jgi:hypothetical protein
MNFPKLAAVIFLFSLFCSSCKNDVDLNAPYKEIPSIYAVLNPQEKLQIIRINKVFLGSGDANVMAKVADSSNYPAGELTVTLKRYNQWGTELDASPGKKTISFRDSVIKTEDGAFSTTQRVYVSNDDLHDANGSIYGDYVLTVKNNRTGNVFTAKASALDSVRGETGIRPMTKPYYPYSPTEKNEEYIDYSTLDPKYPFEVKFFSNEAKIYQLVIRLHFFDLELNGDTTKRYVDYTGGNLFLKDRRTLSGLQPMFVVAFTGRDIFSAAGVGLSKLKLSNNIQGRKMYKIEYLVYSSTQDYIDYLQFAAPSFNISQQKPLYSNFDNQAALGIFTFRTRCSVQKAMHTFFINAFSDNPNTCEYKFYTSDFQLRGCK